MLTSDFNFELPDRLIAQNPVTPRDHSRLLHLIRTHASIEHKHFYDLIELVNPGDVLVLNDTRVMAARLRAQVKGRSGSAEILLLKAVDSKMFQAMVRPGKQFKENIQVRFPADDGLIATVCGIESDGTRLLRFNQEGDVLRETIERIGEHPVPPYIKDSTATKAQYQTVYAREGESAAAPTAGLHFTSELLDKLRNKGVKIEFVTLNVGRGTFLPVKVERVEEHQMHSETYELNEQVANRLNAAKEAGKRIIAVGTTSVRVLETCADASGKLSAHKGETAVFIYPGYSWKVVDALITNFHLPASSLIMLVSAFAGKELTQTAYKTAIEKEYRFYSFGDAMYIE